MSVCMTQ